MCPKRFLQGVFLFFSLWVYKWAKPQQAFVETISVITLFSLTLPISPWGCIHRKARGLLAEVTLPPPSFPELRRSSWNPAPSGAWSLTSSEESKFLSRLIPLLGSEGRWDFASGFTLQFWKKNSFGVLVLIVHSFHAGMSDCDFQPFIKRVLNIISLYGVGWGKGSPSAGGTPGSASLVVPCLNM